MILAHKQALLDRLGTDPILATCGHEGVVLPDPVTGVRPERYWTLHTDSGRRFSDRLGGLPVQATFHYWVHCVGRTPEQAQRLTERVVPLLAGWQPTVPGYAPQRVRHLDSAPADIDADVRPPVHFTVDHFALTTQPA